MQVTSPLQSATCCTAPDLVVVWPGCSPRSRRSEERWLPGQIPTGPPSPVLSARLNLHPASTYAGGIPGSSKSLSQGVPSTRVAAREGLSRKTWIPGTMVRPKETYEKRTDLPVYRLYGYVRREQETSMEFRPPQPFLTCSRIPLTKERSEVPRAQTP